MKRTLTGKIFLRFFFLSTFFLFTALQTKMYASVITVTSTADTGAGTLREAVTTLASSGDLIVFSGAMTITLATPMVIKVSNLTIDATTVTGWSASANKVMLSGGGSATGAFSTNGAMYSCDGLTIKGLIFNGFTGSTIILMDAANFTVKNCWFGLLANGTSASPHTGTNIVVSKTSSYGTIGSSIPSERNIFNITSATAGACIFMSATGTTVYPSQLIYVLGNYFGTDYTGTTVLSMGPSSAIKTSGSNGSGFNIGGPGVNDGNLIEGYSSGHAFQGASPVISDVIIQGNKMGTLSATLSTSSAILLCPDNENMFILNNTIQRSGTYAIDMSPSTYTDQVEVHKNAMSNNTSGGINNTITAPVISSATPAKVMGTGASANGTVDIYSWDGLGGVQGSTWLASVTADASGNWFYYGTFTVGQKLTATSTPVVSSPTPPTSKFANAFAVTTCPSTVSAGADLTTCSTSPSIGITGNGVSVTGSPVWSIVSGGTGSISNSNTFNPTYVLSAGEQANTGSAITVVLQVTVGTSTCAATINDQMVLTINPKPVVNAGGNVTVCANNANTPLGGAVTGATGVLWTGGAGVFSPNATSTIAVYAPTTAEKTAGSVTLTLTSTGNGTCTAATGSKTITITPAPTVNAGTSQTMCANGSINLNGSVTVATGGQWTTTGSIGSLSSATSLTALYTPSPADKAAGSVTLTLTTTGNGTCTPVTSQMTITINPVPIVDAGLDQTVCTPSGNIALGGTVTHATGGQWTTTGGGSFSPNATTLNATYIPTTAEKNTTTVQTLTFTLTSTGNGACGAVTDQMALTIDPSPTASAGLNQTVCANVGSVNLAGSITSATGGTWTTSGNGSFTNPNSLNSPYTLGSTDITNGTVTLTLTSTGNGSCTAATSQLVLTITPAPLVNAGPDQTACASATSVALGGTVTHAGGGQWTTTGGGTFYPDATTLNAAYVPSAAEGATTSTLNLTFSLISTGNGSCASVTDQMNLTITPVPTVNAGANQTICANSGTLNLAGTITGATGGVWTSTGTISSIGNPNASSTSYTPSAADKAAGTVTLTLTTTGNGSCAAVTSQKVITISPAPIVNAGPDQSACVPVSGITLAGTVTNAGGGQWTTTGGGSFSPSATALNASYVPTTAESNTTSALTLTFTLVSTGNGTCSAVTDQMVFTITPAPIVDAGADQTFCATNTNIALNGTVTGAPGGSWTSSGSGTFTNANTLSTVYSPSAADRTAGTVTFTLRSVGGGCTAVSDASVLTIVACLIDPQLAFESPTLFRNNGSDPFKLNFSPLNSTGAITYAVRKLSTLGATSCATIDANGYVKPTCVDTVQVAAYQARKAPYEADTAYYTLYIGKSSTQIALESRGSTVSGPDFSLLVTTNYDQPLTYVIVGGDVNAVSMTSAGVITPLAVGTVYIRATAAGDNNFQAANSNDAVVTIYPLLTKPVAINDTLKLEIGGEETLNIAKNDYGTTGSINLSPRMLIDIDAENSGLQSKYFKPGIGIFTIDSLGNLTFTSFEAFIGVDSIQYTITDENGLVSNKASIVIIVTSPIQEIALKANEIITANNDGKNESLVIGYTDLTRPNDLLVVDAAGNRLYYTNNYQNSWFATDQSGNNLGSGVYYFIFREFTSEGTVRRQLKSNFTVIR